MSYMDSKVSIVMFGKNDNWGGNQKERFIKSLNSFVEKGYDEIIFVDWSSDKISLIEEVQDNLVRSGRIRGIIVHPDVAKWILKNRPGQNPNEVYSRNIGIRRAAGSIIISSSMEIIPPTKEEFVKTIADKDTFYTCSRRDINIDQIPDISIPPHGPSGIGAEDKWSLIDCCGDFQIARRHIWNKIRGFEEDFIGAYYNDTFVQKKAVDAGYKIEAVYDLPVFHINHGKGTFTGVFNNVGEIYKRKVTSNGDDWGVAHHIFPELII